jgi:hypothetical protein
MKVAVTVYGGYEASVEQGSYEFVADTGAELLKQLKSFDDEVSQWAAADRAEYGAGYGYYVDVNEIEYIDEAVLAFLQRQWL